jgi:hypothetical protein
MREHLRQAASLGDGVRHGRVAPPMRASGAEPRPLLANRLVRSFVRTDAEPLPAVYEVRMLGEE